MDNWLILLAEGPQRVGARVTVSIFFGLVAFGGGIVYVLLKTNMLRARGRIFPALYKSFPFFCAGLVFFSVAVSFLAGREPNLPFVGSPNANSRVVSQRPSQPAPVTRSAPPPQPSQPALETRAIYKPVIRETPDEKTMQAANDVWRPEPQKAAVKPPVVNPPAGKPPADKPLAEKPPIENIQPKDVLPENPQMDLAERMRDQPREVERRKQFFTEPVAPTPRETEAVQLATTELPKLTQALSRFSYVGTAVQEGALLGRASGLQFTDRAPVGGVMVGAICFIGDNWGKSVAGIQPIYQVGDKYVKGKICGNKTDRPLLSLADPGGAVIGVNVRIGLIMDATQLVYAPINGTKVDLQEAYLGAPAGSDGGSPRSFDSGGNLIAGIFGTYEKDKSLVSLGMYVIPRIRATDSSEESELRTFASADGKFTIKAKLLKVNEDGTISLEKEDGSKFSAPIKSLSDADQAYIRAKQ